MRCCGRQDLHGRISIQGPPRRPSAAKTCPMRQGQRFGVMEMTYLLSIHELPRQPRPAFRKIN